METTNPLMDNIRLISDVLHDRLSIMDREEELTKKP